MGEMMILEEFTKWKNTNSMDNHEDEELCFKEFASTYCRDLNGVENIIKDLLYQIFNLQCCVEGLIEDQEFSLN